MLRRDFLQLAFLSLTLSAAAAPAWAKDGDSSGGSSNSGSGSSNSGSGSSNSGSGSSENDDGENSGDDSGSDNSGRGSDHDRALSAVSDGRAMPLEDAMKRLQRRYPGKVIDVALRKEDKRLVYRFKVKSDSGKVRKVVMDAVSGDFRGLFGF